MKTHSLENSGFRFYSLGIVVEDKKDDGDYIKVTPIEELPLVFGPLEDTSFNYGVQGTDHKGVMVNSNIKGVSYVAAQWVSISDGNRITAPNVYRSETVLLLKYANTDKVYWCDLFREPGLRRLENVIWMYSNLSEPGEAYDQDTAYWFQVSTRDQLIRLHTSINRDEKAGYDITLNTSEGYLTIEDTNNNSLFWDSVNGNLRINFTNSIEFNTKQYRNNASEYAHTTSPDITDTASSQIILNSNGIINEMANVSINIKANGDTNIDGSLIYIG